MGEQGQTNEVMGAAMKFSLDLIAEQRGHIDVAPIETQRTRDVTEHFAADAEGQRLAVEIVEKPECLVLARRLAGRTEGFDLARTLAVAPEGQLLASVLARTREASRSVVALAGSAEGQRLAIGLAGSPEGLDLVRVLAGVASGQSLAVSVCGSSEGKTLTAVLADTAEGQNLASSLAATPEGRSLTRRLAASPEGRDLVAHLAQSEMSFQRFSINSPPKVLAGAVTLLPLAALMASVVSLGVISAVHHEDAPPGFEVLAEQIRFEEIVKGEDGRQLRGALEALIGLASIEIETGSFDADPLLQEQIQDDRNFLQRELARSPDISAAIAVPVAQRMTAALVGVLSDDVPGKKLAEMLAGTADPDPSDPYRAVDRAFKVADALESSEEAPPTGVSSWREWVVRQLGWREVASDGAAAGAGLAGGAGVVEAIGLTGPAAVIVGVVVAVLAAVWRRVQ